MHNENLDLGVQSGFIRKSQELEQPTCERVNE